MEYNFIPLLEKLSKSLIGDFTITIKKNKVLVKANEKTFNNNWNIGMNCDCPLSSLKFSVKESTIKSVFYNVEIHYYCVDYRNEIPRLYDLSLKTTNLLLNDDGTGEIIYDRKHQWEALREMIIEKTGIDSMGPMDYSRKI